MRRIKRWLCGGMCLLLLLGLLPAAAQAEEGTADWAGEAVETLCKIYGSDLGVSDSLEPMTKAHGPVMSASYISFDTFSVTAMILKPLCFR